MRGEIGLHDCTKGRSNRQSEIDLGVRLVCYAMRSEYRTQGRLLLCFGAKFCFPPWPAITRINCTKKKRKESTGVAGEVVL
jgi:hypothetical protein